MIVYDFDVRRNYVKPLVDETTRLMIPTFSPDGRMCAYVRDNNIWIKKFDYDTEVQVTKDGEANKILNGITDWVYEEEFSVTNMLAWSPDSQVLAFLRFDESGIPISNCLSSAADCTPANTPINILWQDRRIRDLASYL